MSRWGYHCCSYNTYQVLKKLNALCEKARCQFGSWKRWARKNLRNRSVYKYVRSIKDFTYKGKVVPANSKTGRQYMGQQQEPFTNPYFIIDTNSPNNPFTRGNKELYIPVAEDVMTPGRFKVFIDRGIPAMYKQARTPVPFKEMLVPLPYDILDLDKMLLQAQDASLTFKFNGCSNDYVQKTVEKVMSIL